MKKISLNGEWKGVGISPDGAKISITGNVPGSALNDIILAGIEEENLKNGKEKIAEILKWVLEGFNETFLKKADINKESFEQLKEEYIQELSVYIEILKTGFIERKEYYVLECKRAGVKYSGYTNELYYFWKRRKVIDYDSRSQYPEH